MEKIHPETGKVLHRDVRPAEYDYRGEKIVINQPGWYPDDDSDAIFNRDDWKIADRAFQTVKARYEEKISKNDFVQENVSFA